MDKTLCEQFDTLRKYLPDDSSNSTTSDINKLGNAKNYCSNEDSEEAECKTELDQIKAGCLWLFEQLFVKNGKSNINNVGYIIIWLSYKLNQKTYAGINDLNDFYTNCIKNNRHYINCKQDDQDCSTSLKSNTGYTNYKNIIDARKGLLNINIQNMSKFYDAFKLLCNMYTKLYANTNNKEYLNYAKQFVDKYNELNDDSSISGDSSCKQVLSTLSNDYNDFKSSCDSNGGDCNDIPSLTSTETEGIVMKSSEKICNDTPSLSIVKKLILALLIFSAISIFLGIFFKCSLFVLRKRAQKQYLREKLKK
ncbi:YIR protein [Plasmodium yoelii]|uniref:YIR protein n=1 Tax=Plasmodium yoelii TaxID=5861 RepID=A0A077X9X7_PLAYE|nr:YIR protein [Plasmodium yoelii]